MSNLNKKQFEAVETVNGPVVIIAGPGTGKTKTLVERTVNIIVNKKVEAKKIMITTFTNKAAKELELRINERLEELNKNMIIVLDDIERENDTNKIYENILFLGELSEHFKDTKTTTLLLAQHSYLEDKLKEIYEITGKQLKDYMEWSADYFDTIQKGNIFWCFPFFFPPKIFPTFPQPS